MKSPSWIPGTFLAPSSPYGWDLSSPMGSRLLFGSLLLPLSFWQDLTCLLQCRPPCWPPSCYLSSISPCWDRPGLALSKNLWGFPINVFVLLKFPVVVSEIPHRWTSSKHSDAFATLFLLRLPDTSPRLNRPSFSLPVLGNALCTLLDLSAMWLCLAPHSADYALPSTEYHSRPCPRGASQSISSALLASSSTLPTSLPALLLYHWLRPWPYTGCRILQGGGGILQGAGKQIDMKGRVRWR